MVGEGEARGQGDGDGGVTYNPSMFPMKPNNVTAETHTGTSTRADALLSHWAVENIG